MMRHRTSLIVLAAFVAFGLGSSVSAQGKSKSAKPPTAATVSHGPKTTSHGPKTTAASHGPKTTTAKQGAASTAKGPKTTSARGPKTTTSGGQKAASARPPQASGKGTTTTQTTTQAGVVTTTLGPNVPKNAQLADRLRTRLGLAPGTDLTPYAAGFRNQGQFIAAVNNAFNHQISFTELKNLMVNQGLSLGEAKQRLGVSANTQDQVRRVPPPPQ
jgi:hypothetical protein